MYPMFKLEVPLVGTVSQTEGVRYVWELIQICRAYWKINITSVAVSPTMYGILTQGNRYSKSVYRVMGLHIYEVPWLDGVTALPLPDTVHLAEQMDKAEKVNKLLTEFKEDIDGLV